ncbi:MAG TPA: hypothetical protein DEO38_00755 [Bacteroidales bacterium]|nr:hypothetical protein [Bacteroidales bacterium]
MEKSELVTYHALSSTVYVVSLTDADTPESLLGQLPYDVDLSNYKSVGRQREIAGIRILLRQTLGDDVRLEYHNGRPFLKHKLANDYSPLPHISISHSHGILALAVNPHYELGMDLEVFGNKIRRVRERFLSAEELAWLINDDERLTRAHIAWTVKESVFKIFGDPVYNFQSKITISPHFSAVTALNDTYPVFCSHNERYAISVVEKRRLLSV